MDDCVSDVDKIAYVVQNKPEDSQIIEFPEDSTADYEYDIVKDGQGHHGEPLR